MKRLFFIVLVVMPIFIFGQWVQEGNDIDGEYAGDLSGYSVSLSSDGSIVAVGSLRNNGDSSGHVSIYKNNFGVWFQMGLNINGEGAGDQFGYSTKLSADGNTVAAGSRTNNGVNGALSGHVRVFTYNNGTNSWTQLGGDIDGKVADERFGAAIDLSSDGRTFVAGARLNSDSGVWRGHVRVFTYSIGTGLWEQVGNDILGEAERDQFGHSVAISNDGGVVAIGATRNDAGGINDAGHVRVFNYNSGTNTWDQLGGDIDGTTINDNFGYSISMNADGSIVAISNDDASASGYTIIYKYDLALNSWVQLGNVILGESNGDKSGYSISLSDDGNTIAIGAIGGDGASGTDANSGYVRIFKYNTETNLWKQEGNNIDGESAGDRFGRSVSVSLDGSIFASGADINAGNGTNSGHTRIYRYTMGALSSKTSNLKLDFKIFPNPTSGLTNIILDNTHEKIELSIFDFLGKKLSSEIYLSTNQIVFDTHNYVAGSYFAEVKTKNRTTFLKFIVVE